MHNDTQDNESHSGLSGYKSPIKKLAESFKRSRDNLREKHKKLKKTIKGYKIKIRDLTGSRDKWKLVAKKLEKDLVELREKEKKKTTPS